jgi:von Willebrand factor type A domain/Aerotolerance regulator N-terminal
VPLTTPLVLLGLVFIPAVLAMYLLKLRRDETVVPSTLLWSGLVADIEANAPWQRLRRNLLLLVQLLLVLLLVLLAARPFVEHPAGLAGDVVVVVDTSASMGATDVGQDRLTAAKKAVVAALGDLPVGGRVSLIAADQNARIVVNGSDDLGRIRQALEDIDVTAGRGDLGDALELAGKLAARSVDAQILVATDGALASPVAVGSTVPAKVTVLPVGRERKNQAIVALAVRAAPSAVTRSVFVSIANLDLELASRRLEVWGDGALIEVRDVRLEAQARSDIVIDDIPADVATLELRLVAADPTSTGPPDQLAVDDRAWAVIPGDQDHEVLIVGPGDPYLETALSYLPHVRLFTVTPDRYPQDATRTDGSDWDLIIFEGTIPSTLPRTPILAIGPDASSELGDVSGTLTGPAIGSLDPAEPILRYVDLSTTHIASAARLTLPDWARSVIPGSAGAPLLYAGSRAGLPTAVLAFEPRDSDLPLQVAFPVLLANLTGELLGGSDAPAEAVAPGSPVNLAIPSGSSGLAVTRPDGTVVELVPGTPEAATVTFSATELPGIYEVVAHGAPATSPAPGSTGSAPTAASSAIGSPPASSATSSDPTLPVRFAVDLFDVDESTIAPGSAAAIEAVGTPSAGPGAGGDAGSRPPARDELWVPLVVLVLIGLSVEWAIYHRDALIRIRRRIAARLPGRAAESST